MIKFLLAIMLALSSAFAFAAVDINKANQAELETIKGIGPSMSARILDARKNGSFKDWADLRQRVKGVGERTAAKFSADGLTVNGASFNVSLADAKPTRYKAVKSDKTDKDGTKTATEKKADKKAGKDGAKATKS